MTSTQNRETRQSAVRPATPAWVIAAAFSAAGAILAAAGWALGHTTLLVAWKAGNASQVNGLCASGIGQLGQAVNAGLRNSCGQVALYEQASGWLIILGVITVAGGIAWAAWQHHTAS